MARPKEEDKDFIPVHIHTSIPAMQWKKCKLERWSWNKVFSAGFAVMVAGGDFPARIRDLELQMDAVKKQVAIRDKTILELTRRR